MRAPKKTPETQSAIASIGENDDAGFLLNESIVLLMRTILFGLRAGFKSTLAHHKVSISAWYYMRVLWVHDGISQRELTERVGAMQPNTVSVLKSLERTKMVAIDRKGGDRRSTRVWLTPKAKRLVEKTVTEMRARSMPVVLAGFDGQEEAELRRLLQKISDNIRNSGWTEE